MKIIGISGKKQAGKDSATEYFISNLLKRYDKCIRIGFADALKDEVVEGCGISREFLEEHKVNFRLIMQGWGTDFRRELFSKDYWLIKLGCKLVEYKNTNTLIIVPDVRFKNEAQLIRDCNGLLIRIQRDKKAFEELDIHASECELDSYDEFDYVVDNNGSLQNLEEEIKFIIYQFKL